MSKRERVCDTECVSVQEIHVHQSCTLPRYSRYRCRLTDKHARISDLFTLVQ